MRYSRPRAPDREGAAYKMSLDSKSRYLADLQCPKRLWLETRKPELG